jgi:hypothetical protein
MRVITQNSMIASDEVDRIPYWLECSRCGTHITANNAVIPYKTIRKFYDGTNKELIELYPEDAECLKCYKNYD